MLHPPPVRPTFKFILRESPEGAMAMVEEALREDSRHPHQIRGPHVVLTVPPEDRHFWSPWLTMEVLPADSGSVFHGRFSPKPAVWTGFMFGYITLTTAACFGLMFAVSLAIVGKSAWLAAVSTAVFVLAAGGMYVASQIGQRLARTQMNELHTMVSEIFAGVQSD